MLSRFLATRPDRSIILVRLAVGLAVFVPEGIQKPLFPDVLGAGRFAKIGIPLPELMAPLVGWVELACGLLIVLGLLTRVAAAPLIFIMFVKLVSTKLPIWLGHDWWIFNVRELDRDGLWSAQHESRTDMCMLLGSIFLLITGSPSTGIGNWAPTTGASCATCSMLH